MASGEKLLCGVEGPDAQLSPAGQCLLKVLGNPFVKNTLDWLPLIVFYALTSSMPFAYAALVGALLGCLTILATQVRSVLDPRVMSPKVLDVGFVVIFGLFAVLSFSTHAIAALVKTWYNPLTDLGLTLIVAAGNALGYPFVLAYAREEIPVTVWQNPNIQANIIKGCLIASWQWLYLFLAMTLVAAVPPVVQVIRHGKPSPPLDLWFGQIAQFVILGLGLFKFMVWDRWKREAEQARLRATSEELCGEYGNPLSKTPVPAAAKCPKGTTIANLTSNEFHEVAILLRKAFWNDPLYTAWQGIGNLPDPEREAAMETALACHLRQMERWGHLFGVSEEKWFGQSTLRAVICCVPAWRGDETDLAWSPTSFAMSGWNLPAPSDDTKVLAEARKTYLKGRPHLYIWFYGGDPESCGKGFGRAALQHALSIADARGVPTVLETCTLSNRAHYQHKGFKVVSECLVSGCTEPWSFMVREPQAQMLGYGSIEHSESPA